MNSDRLIFEMEMSDQGGMTAEQPVRNVERTATAEEAVPGPPENRVQVMETIFLGGPLSEAAHALRESGGSSRSTMAGLYLIVFLVIVVGIGAVSVHLNMPPSALPDSEDGGYPPDGRIANFALAGVDVLVTLAVVMFCVGVYALLTNRRYPDASEFSDTRLVGPLAETLGSADYEMRRTAAQALIRLLPTLRASDSGLLNARQRTCLNQALTGNNTALVLAILRAYEQVGDRAALPLVQALAEGQYTGGRSLQVREAARACLPYLEIREQQVQQALTLLRPSSGEAVTQELLLRPVSTTAEVEATQLLRSAEGD